MQPSLDLYLQHVRVGKRLATRTVDIYAYELQELATLCTAQSLNLTDVQNTHIRRWIAKAHSAGKGSRSLALQLSAWRGFYKWLVMRGDMVYNPCADIKPPKAAKPLPKALGVDAAMALVDFVPHKQLQEGFFERDHLMIELLYGCGLRVGELIGLDLAASPEAMTEGRGWIDAESSEVHVFGKGSKRRMVPLGEKAALALQRYLAERHKLCQNKLSGVQETALLLGTKGQRITRHSVWQMLKVRSLQAGLDQWVHPHMLRHSFASHILQSSGDLRAVQELLGHSSIASTQVYTRLDFQHLAKIYDNSHPRAKKRNT
jgi:integrase/recombinase XerC